MAIGNIVKGQYIFYKAGIIMYKYSNNFLPECIALWCLRNNSIHEHNTRGCNQLRELPGVKILYGVMEVCDSTERPEVDASKNKNKYIKKRLLCQQNRFK